MSGYEMKYTDIFEMENIHLIYLQLVLEQYLKRNSKIKVFN